MSTTKSAEEQAADRYPIIEHNGKARYWQCGDLMCREKASAEQYAEAIQEGYYAALTERAFPAEKERDELRFDLGLMTIDRDHYRTMTASCSEALAGRDAQISELRATLQVVVDVLKRVTPSTPGPDWWCRICARVFDDEGTTYHLNCRKCGADVVRFPDEWAEVSNSALSLASEKHGVTPTDKCG